MDLPNAYGIHMLNFCEESNSEILCCICPYYLKCMYIGLNKRKAAIISLSNIIIILCTVKVLFAK